MALEGLERTRERTGSGAAEFVPPCAPLEPRACVEPFGTIGFSAEVQGNHLVLKATWSDPLPAPESGLSASTVLSAYVFCCDGVVTSKVDETTIRSGPLDAEVSISGSSIADECGSAATIAVRTFLHWRMDGVDPPTLAGVAVFDAVFDRAGGAHTLVETARWPGLEDACFPPEN